MDINPRRDGSGDNDETQATFRQASAVLEAAHRRISLLRHNLLELTESAPSLGSQPIASSSPSASNSANVRPPHDAILLSGSTTEDQNAHALDMARVRSSLSPSVMDRLQQFEAEYLGDASPNTTPETISLPPAPSGTTIRQLPAPSRIIHPPWPSSHVPSPSGRSWPESYRRDANNDDPSTALGRRVAAREGRQVVSTAQGSIPQLQQIILDSAATIVRSLESFNNSLQQRIQNHEPSPLSRPELIPIHTTVDGRFRRTLQTSGGRGSQSPVGVNATQTSSSTLFPARPPTIRRLRSMRVESVRQTTGTPALSPLASSGSGQSNNGARLSMLSNFSTVDNLSTPVTPLSHERPILFDEPDSYVPQSTIIEPPPEPSRGYFIRRRINPDGDEFIHNVFWNDSFDDPVPSMSPRQPSENLPYRWGTSNVMRPVHRIESNQESWSSPSRPPAEVPRRRRGWARLDADGNEIPMDEEDQLERLRSEHRIRAQQQSRAQASSQTESPSGTIVLTAVPADEAGGQNHTPPSRAMTATAEQDTTIALARRDIGLLANALDSVVSLDRSRRFSWSQAVSSAQSSTDTLESDSSEMYGSSTPFFVDPLPMPLSVMVTVPKKTLAVDEGCSMVGGRVSKHASYTGR